MASEAPRHVHHCSTFECANFYVCRDRDCRDEWTCPRCEDDQYFADIQQLEQELTQRTTHPQHKGH